MPSTGDPSFAAVSVHSSPASGPGNPAGTFRPDGFAGALVLQGADALDEATAGAVLSRLDHLIRWAQAQQAKVLHRMEVIYRNELHFPSGKPDPGLAFSLAASEAAAILSVPQTTGQRLMVEAEGLCRDHAATLGRLEQGGISYHHAQTVLDQSQDIEPEELPAFEAKLLDAAAGQTQSQFRVRARRLRENQYPQTIVKRQLTAFEKRKVCLEQAEDGMSWLSALLPAENAQAIFTQLSKAARGEQAAGDPRTVDGLRADILQELLIRPADGEELGGDGASPAGTSGSNGANSRSNLRGRSRGSTSRSNAGAKARAEILVLISAETLFGADDQPAELHGYGPISPQTARRMARDAAKWTPVERDPDTEEILRIGRRRKIPAGLQRWLRARDGTCRFPGCRYNAVISEIDHTKPWAQGGVTDHDNLEHLCRRHHMFKTQGFWKACQPAAGIIEWTSPGGRTYRTEPHLALAPVMQRKGPDLSGAAPVVDAPDPDLSGTRPDRVTSRLSTDVPTETSIDTLPDSSEADYGAHPPPF
ncbi:DUF222 domain-containing protein [Arthrobacter sp. ATA002]|uniref:HNH endonuclease signature motif containing protein n=1 Tax=Arthrobacter sp. ATA002 TaxID=2991715 RepID=UPI0022A764E5|nr:HNH endonuclease signature motif containing protein [Arthrobacter sp. ATA002]WAP52418.1 DUF222 domain-containing protein [Arthrobacter sp. ATA002]